MTELDKLEQYLKEHGYEYDRIDNDGTVIEHSTFGNMIFGERHQIIVHKGDRVWYDVICHQGSYGHDEGLLEMMGELVRINDTVEGFLTAEDVIKRMENDEQ